jgi:hypothetical protein
LRFLFTFLVLHGRRISRKDKKGPKGQTWCILVVVNWIE